MAGAKRSFDVPFPLRHRCTCCGASCSGLSVWVDEGKARTRLEEQARRLGVEVPVVDGMIRREGGECAFLDGERRCRIHAEFGYEAKPIVCRMFPMAVIKAEGGVRVGIDPGCFGHILSWRSGPLVPEGEMLAAPRQRAEEQDEAEREFFALSGDPGTTVASLLEALSCGRLDGGPDLPKGFARRLIHRVEEALPILDGVVAGDDAGSALREVWADLRPALGRLDRRQPPRWPALAPEEDAYAVNAVRRMVYLRLTPKIPIVSGTALLVLSGAVLCAWIDPSREAFGRNVAAWCRMVRIPAFWLAITPDGDAMTWLARGGGA